MQEERRVHGDAVVDPAGHRDAPEVAVLVQQPQEPALDAGDELGLAGGAGLALVPRLERPLVSGLDQHALGHGSSLERGWLAGCEEGGFRTIARGGPHAQGSPTRPGRPRVDHDVGVRREPPAARRR